MSDTTTLIRWPIMGHAAVVGHLAAAVAAGQVAHAYLFSGPDGIGKRTVARTLAQALLCTVVGRAPCGECRACLLAASARHPDMLTLDMAWQSLLLPDKAKAQSVTVEAVRLMSSELARRPHEGRWKILLVPQAEELTIAAANAFLKTLEEPPSSVVILLTTRDPELVLPTIRSRCQPVTMRPLPVAEVATLLQQRWGHPPEQATLLARVSGGRIGWAIQAAQEPSVLAARSEALAQLAQAIPANRADRLLLAATLSKQEAPTLLQQWASWWRDVLLVQSGAGEVLTNVDQRGPIEEAARRHSMDQVRTFLRELQRLSRVGQESNANRQLLWEVLLLKLPHPPSAP